MRLLRYEGRNLLFTCGRRPAGLLVIPVVVVVVVVVGEELSSL